MKSRLWVVLDAAMLVAVLLLQTWRLTGVPLHEWLSVALIAAIVMHLAVHWNWIATRSRRIFQPGTGRTRVNFALNAVLFASMTVAMASGFFISKVVLPAHLTPVEFLKYHGIHETSSRVALAAMALHLALNWDVLFASRPRVRMMLRPVGWIALSAALLTGAVYAVERVMPAPEIEIIQGGKRIRHAQPPPDIAQLRRDQIRPEMHAWPQFASQVAIVAVAAFVGRKVGLRLD